MECLSVMDDGAALAPAEEGAGVVVQALGRRVVRVAGVTRRRAAVKRFTASPSQPPGKSIRLEPSWCRPGFSQNIISSP